MDTEAATRADGSRSTFRQPCSPWAAEAVPGARSTLNGTPTTGRAGIAAEDMPHIPISERVVLTGSRLKDDVLTTVRRAEYIRVKSVKEMGSA